jgi:hypothetical protein
MTARLLCIVNTEDEERNQNAMAGFQTCFTIIPVRGINDALSEVVKGRKLEAAQSRTDIILLDVNMERDRSSGKWTWGAGDGIFAYGPLLALPYLNVSRMTQFAPYSEFWDKPEVNRNGYVLLSLSFIFSAIKRRVISLERVNELLTLVGGVKTPHEAISLGLRRFRRRLLGMAKRGDVKLFGVADAIKDINDLIEGCSESETIMVLKPGTQVPISIGWSYRDSEHDEVQVISIFADTLGFDPSPGKQRLRMVVEELTNWPIDSTQEIEFEYLHDSATEILIRCATFSGEADILVNAVDGHDCVLGSFADKYQVRRVVILFAWVVAWYCKMFLCRPGTWNEVRNIFYHGGKVTTFDQRYKTYLGENRQTVSYLDHRTPFRTIDSKSVGSHGEFVRESYMLNENRPGCLLPMDCRLCQKFATSGLVEFFDAWEGVNVKPWVESLARPYPRWMRESGFRNIAWNRQWDK